MWQKGCLILEKSVRKKNRDSNIELLRIVAMCLIIFHHMALNTGIIDGYTISKTMIFGIIGGIGGKIGVVIFVLITGYFSIHKKFSAKKVFILWLQIFCYSVGFMLVFRITGIEKCSKVDTIKTFFPLAYNQYWFITVYLYLLFLTPFINKFLIGLSKENYNKLLIVLTIIFVVIPTIFYSNGLIGSTQTPIGLLLFVYIYMIGGYIKIYGLKYFENKKLRNIILICLGYILIIAIVLIGKKIEQKNIFWSNLFGYYREMNSLFILIPSIALFYLFKEWKLKYNRVINYFASISFAVYLFHESNFMRYRLWHNVFGIDFIQKLPIGPVSTLIIAIISFYCITALIEVIRKNVIEKNILKIKALNNLFNKIDNFMFLR